MVFTNIERSKLPTVENQVFLFAVNFVTHKRHNKREKHSLKETVRGKKKKKKTDHSKRKILSSEEKRLWLKKKQVMAREKMLAGKENG